MYSELTMSEKVESELLTVHLGGEFLNSVQCAEETFVTQRPKTKYKF